MKILNLILCIHAFFLFSIYGQSKSEKFIFPYIDRNACPFEGCQYGKWTSHSKIKVYQFEGDTTKIIYYLHDNEEFIAQTGNVHILMPGVVIIKKKIYNFCIGDTILVLTYLGEGFYKIYDGKNIYEYDFFWKINDNTNSNLDTLKYSGLMISNLKMVWWISILFDDNKKGWICLKNISKIGFLTKEKISGCDKLE